MDDIATAYDAVVRDWGVPVRRVTVDGARARTRVLTCGPDDAPPLLCLPVAGTPPRSGSRRQRNSPADSG